MGRGTQFWSENLRGNSNSFERNRGPKQLYSIKNNLIDAYPTSSINLKIIVLPTLPQKEQFERNNSKLTFIADYIKTGKIYQPLKFHQPVSKFIFLQILVYKIEVDND